MKLHLALQTACRPTVSRTSVHTTIPLAIRPLACSQLHRRSTTSSAHKPVGAQAPMPQQRPPAEYDSRRAQRGPLENLSQQPEKYWAMVNKLLVHKNSSNKKPSVLAEKSQPQKRSEAAGTTSAMNHDTFRNLAANPFSPFTKWNYEELKQDDFAKKWALKAGFSGVRLRPSTGRTVECLGKEISRAFRLLEGQVKKNKVRREEQLQRYHERGGAKRKRLRRERWRARFFNGFKATVSRVNELRRQGW